MKRTTSIYGCALACVLMTGPVACEMEDLDLEESRSEPDAGSPEPDASPSELDAGSPTMAEPDASEGQNCAPTQIECGEDCVELGSTDHCAGCDDACAADRVCRRGPTDEQNACACPQGSEECSGSCVDTMSDPQHCGGCGVECSGGTSCVGGVCACPDGLGLCDGECVSLETKEDCGACGTSCTIACSSEAGAPECVEVTRLDTVEYHSCASTSDGGLWCWGRNLGVGDRMIRSVPTLLDGPTYIRALDAGSTHSCVIDGGADVWCWGNNDLGQVTEPMGGWALVPKRQFGLSAVTRIALGETHSCAVVDSNTNVECWGNNQWGQLGDGTTLNSASPVRVRLPAGEVQDLQANGAHTCALMLDGNVYCWGRGERSQLGSGQEGTNALPLRVPLPASEVVQTIAISTYHSCVSTVAGAVYCWGYSNQGQAGLDERFASAPNKVRSASGGALTDIVSVAIGKAGGHTIALDASGVAWSWGENGRGQLGTGTTQNTPIAHPIQTSMAVESAHPGIAHTYLLLADSSVVAFGSNTSGRLGIGTTANVDTPEPITQVTQVEHVSIGAFHSCLLTHDGDVACFGSGSVGQLGNGQNTSSATPVSVDWSQAMGGTP